MVKKNEIGPRKERGPRVMAEFKSPSQPPRDGACKSYPTEWWFPPKHATKESMENMASAKKICSSCHVRQECLEYAIVWEAFGIWGGMTENQRMHLRRRLNIQSQRAAEFARIESLI